MLPYCRSPMISHFYLALLFHLVMDDRQTKLLKQFYLIALVIIKLHKHYIPNLISKARFMEKKASFQASSSLFFLLQLHSN